MKVEITTEGLGRGTIVTIDGDRLKHVRSVNLSISADGIPVLSIEQLPVDEDGQFLLEFDECGKRIKTATLRIKGAVVFSGEAIGLAQASC